MAGRAEHDDGQDPGAFVLPQPAQHIKAGYLRQVDVKQDESRQAVAGAGAVTAQEVIDSSGTVTYDHDFVIYVIEPQCTKGQVDIVLVVLDQEYMAGLRLHRFCSHSGCLTGVGSPPVQNERHLRTSSIALAAGLRLSVDRVNVSGPASQAALCGDWPGRQCRWSLSGNGVAGHIDQLAERFGFTHGKVSVGLAVECETGNPEAVHEAGVAQPFLAGSGVDAGDPQAPEVVLLVAPVTVAVVRSVEQRLGRVADVLAAAAEPFRPLEDLLVPGAAYGTGLDSWHSAAPYLSYGSAARIRTASASEMTSPRRPWRMRVPDLWWFRGRLPGRMAPTFPSPVLSPRALLL